jgi:hypothetical protein
MTDGGRAARAASCAARRAEKAPTRGVRVGALCMRDAVRGAARPGKR